MKGVCEFVEESLGGTRHRPGTCGNSRHLVRPRHSKESVEVCCPCGVEQIEESLAGAGEREAGREAPRDTQTGKKALTSLATYTRPAGIGRWPGCTTGMVWSLGGSCLLLLRLSHAYTCGSLSVGVIACDAAQGRHGLAFCGCCLRGLCMDERCSDCYVLFKSHPLLSSAEGPHPGKAVRMRDGSIHEAVAL
jgi:hypothetical protein